MKVSIPVYFEVEPVEGSEEEMAASVAMNAVEWAAENHLVFVEEVTQGSAHDDVEVHAEGFGKVRVTLIGTSE